MAIQQHPIPQNVTSYQFRLVGDMTLKQFFQLAGGIVVGLVIYATGLPFFFKWPLVALAVGLGAGMAFLPVQGRPMDQWLLAFFRSIYQPTIFTWAKAIEPAVIPVPTPTPPQPASTPVGGKVEVTPTLPKPVAEIRMDALSSFQPTTAVTAVPVLQPAKPVPPTTPTQTAAPRQVITTYREAPIRVQPQDKPVAPEAQAGPRAAINPQIPTQTTASQAQARVTSTPVFSSTLPIPSTPQTPNTVVGMTLTPDGKILEGAIVEIRLQSTTVRATKSNKLGQFMFLKPLDNSVYHLTAEKDGYTFPTFSLTAAGKVILPIKLQATALVATAAPTVQPRPPLPARPTLPPLPPQRPQAVAA